MPGKVASPDPARVRAGLLGARARWGPEPRTVRLDALDPRVRAAVLALIRADEAARESEAVPDAA